MNAQSVLLLLLILAGAVLALRAALKSKGCRCSGDCGQCRGCEARRGKGRG